MNKKINIAVDGTAGSGKSATMEIVANKLGLKFIDTGLMYRAFTKFCINQKINFDDRNEIVEQLNYFNYDADADIVLVNGENYTNLLMGSDVLNFINKVTVIPEVREFMVKAQRKMAETKGNVMIGRDITTIVLPDADYKIYLDSSVEVRAKRRFAQNEARNIIPNNYEEIYQKISERDENDKTREVGPLLIGEDVIVIDNSDLTLDETVNKILEIVKK